MGSTGALISAQITREAQQYGVNSRRISSFVISAQSEVCGCLYFHLADLVRVPVLATPLSWP